MNTRELRTQVLRAIESAGLAAEILQEYRSISLHKCCLCCQHFQEKVEMCVLAGQKPPARVIAFGCPKYEDLDEVPF